jgi:GcrA cell cycle regulator
LNAPFKPRTPQPASGIIPKKMRFAESRFDWTDENVAEARRLWLEGASATQICVAIGCESRNAVIGKIHRMKLGKRAETKKSPAPTPSPLVVKPLTTMHGTEPRNGRAGMARPIVQPKSVAFEDMPARPASESRLLTLFDLKPGMCKWPLGEPRDEEFRYCAADRCGEGPYCSAHQAIAYAPAQPRRRAAA